MVRTSLLREDVNSTAHFEEKSARVERMRLSGHALFVELEQIVLSVLEIDEAVGFVALLPGAYAEVADVNAEVHDVRAVLVLSEVRKLEQSELIPVGIRGLAVDVYKIS